MDANRAMQQVIMGRTTDEDDPEDSTPRAFEGKIKTVSGGQIKFVVPAWDGGKYEFGPVPYAVWTDQSALSGDYAHVHTMVGPQPGDTCLVLFLGGNADIDAQSPWVLGWRPA
ncbi:MAG TPA: hypothetical protein VFT75_18285 [Nocardioidaceae bacterium]|nr:hypothetical protein [Nocardioidaceae bacterium]